jgi:L-ascorbate metabolism protein UlaG (beta-lactamase superfamily)
MVTITWLGHSSFQLVIDGKKVLIDPWISNPTAKKKGIRLEDYLDVDLVVVTHGHQDHMGESIEILRKSEKAKLVAIFEIANYIATKGVDESRVIGGNMGGPILTGVGDLRVALTPANHSSPIGSPTGVVIIGNEARVYHAGDTGIMSEMELIGEIYKPDIAILPIGGHFTMDPLEASFAVKMLKPKIAIPMHYGTFPVLYGKASEFKDLVKKTSPQTEVVVLEPGVPKELKV